MNRISHDFIIGRSTESDAYTLWKFDADNPEVLSPVPLTEDAKLDRRFHLVQIGSYLLQWGPLELQNYYPCYPYRLTEIDITSKDPLGARPVQHGAWPKTKFWHGRVDFGNPEGDKKKFAESDELKLLSLDNYMLNFIPTPGRGTYQLWNFDPASRDPLPVTVSPQGAWGTIQDGHKLIPIGGYIIDWVPETGAYCLWSFDPQGKNPVILPAIQEGQWADIRKGHQLVPIGNYILDWVPADGTFRLWNFDPESANPLAGSPVQSGKLPGDFSADTTLTGVQPLIPVREEHVDTAGTIDFMRSKIKHVVYYMVENRAFDHVCGWLYENGEQPKNVVGPDGPFKGASCDFFNMDGDDKVHLSQYKDGKLSEDYLLELLSQDPYHDYSDVIRQLFNDNPTGYENRETPNMGGFLKNNGSRQVMETYSPTQLPVLNGLAKNFAVSDEWFCSMPGGTDVNRAFSLTGSSFGKLNNFQNGAEYEYWPQSPHRPSIWKTLWSNGIKDWKIYNSIEWMDFVFTYHLFLDGQIPTVDKDTSNNVATLDHFFDDVKNGTLPAFSYLEPVWIAKTGTTSYHPGADLIPGELALNKIFNALQDGPKWDETLLVITFDEHGGVYDHLPPSYVKNPYPNDLNNGFSFDLLGVRIPTILVSPRVKDQTVFRSETSVPYDSTSILATLLDWCGIPKARWGLGERTKHAPTFEGALLSSKSRKDKTNIAPPYDKEHPKDGGSAASYELHDLHRLMIPRLVWHISKGKLSDTERQAISDDILSSVDNLNDLDTRLKELNDRCA